ncbi:uncharacterized protein LOC105830252 isoform X1 [Monomorium pharaonis]|uniref:uncharacterized protein LOC105830252 isoform X1 n=1 Tax=Monomorium pharaonis TaxID=307658 RepID=UPI0017475DA0|nr:uncharacterized protein LOC105830252 isoform X1 [Monomorium pharaonis]
MAYNTKASSSSSLKNASDNLCEINKAYNTSQATEDKNFKTFVVKSLIDITNRVKRCECLLKKKQDNSEQLENQVYDTENKILDEKFPMQNLDDVKNIEQQLKHDEKFRDKVKSALYFYSQTTMKKL